MSDEQIISTIKLILDGRELRTKPGVYRQQGTSVWEVRASVFNHDGIGYQDVLLAEFEDAATAVRIKNILTERDLMGCI